MKEKVARFIEQKGDDLYSAAEGYSNGRKIYKKTPARELSGITLPVAFYDEARANAAASIKSTLAKEGVDAFCSQLGGGVKRLFNNI